MIGYPISQADLEARIAAKSASWLRRAANRIGRLRKKARYEERSSIWNEVKSVYMTLQGGSKCAYCERKFADLPHGSIELDVEHFRPKGRVLAWEMPEHLKEQGIDASPVPAEDRGYFLLPYHPFNYLASCKVCNSQLKKTCFPIAGDYDLTGEDPVDLLKEKPYLIYPIGDFDAVPEELIKFHGISPQAVANGGHDRARALVTIEFFELDNLDTRKNLVRERAAIIVALHPQLSLASSAAGAVKAVATQIVDGFTSSTAPHTNCARSFKRLFESDPVEAQAIFEGAAALIDSIS
ncbi:MAG: hypothetical protein JXM73_04240 [Anaerolineae bacterium]|nr:hypothetical protein [Anaerolineae bacterium]